MTLLPRTIRLDASDAFVFDPAAEPGEWALSCAFLFADVDVAALPRKARTACRAGFLGVESWGFSTLAVVAEASAAERAALEDRLAAQFVARLGAPDPATALPAAREEVAFAASLCAGHPPGMLLAVHRAVEDGRLREQFRTLRPRQARDGIAGHARAFLVIESEGEDAPEPLDLLALRGPR